MDDHSRFIVGYGLHASASGALVREVLEAAIANFGAPLEVLTDNGTQYKTWRGVSEFTQLLTRRGIRHVVASPRRPQTVGYAELRSMPIGPSYADPPEFGADRRLWPALSSSG